MAKVTTARLDKDLKIISLFEWRQRREDEAYWLLAKHDETKMTVTAEWSGEILNAHNTPRKHWQPFALNVVMNQTHDSWGAALATPKAVRDVLSSGTYATLEQLEEAYNKFVHEYTAGPAFPSFQKLTMGAPDPVFVPPPPPVAPVFSPMGDEDDEDTVEDPEIVPVAYEPPPPDADKVTSGGGDW